MDIPKIVGSIFTGTYFHYKDVPKEKLFERTIAERTKLKGKFDEIKRKEQNINSELFKAYFTDYQSPSNMYKKLSKWKDTVNDVWVDFIKKVLSKSKRVIEYTPIYDAAKIEENEKIIDIAERIIELNNKIQSGQRLKLLTPSQMLRRLPISLAQLNPGNNSKKLKIGIRQLLFSPYRSKKLTKISCTSLVGIIQTWKQSLITLKIVRQMSLTNLFINLLKKLILRVQITQILD